MLRKLAIPMALAALAACSDGTAPVGARQVSLSFTTAPSGSPLASATGFGLGANLAAGDTIVSGSDTIEITRVRLVLREIELKRADDDVCEDIAGEDAHDACEEFSTGPLLVDLPLSGGVETEITITADTGTYGEIDFEIHKPEDDAGADSDFLAANPDFRRVSIRVEGTFNGQDFTYETDLNVEQEIELADPIVVTPESQQLNLTLRVDLDGWFRTASGAVVDPASANKGGTNEGLVKDNIKNSFRAFEDHDRDGHEDHDEDGGSDDGANHG